MSLIPLTVDIWRSQISEDDGGGETEIPGIVHAGISVTISYPDKNAVNREDTAQGSRSGPGPLTRSDRVLFLDPWDGTVIVEVNDVVKPNPSVVWLPAALKVVAVRPYADGSLGELQLDCEDIE